MKKLTLVIVLVLMFNSVSIAQTLYTTQSGYFASTSEQILNKAIGMLNDTAALSQMSSAKLIFVLKPGLKVYLVESRWSGTVKVRLKGTVHEVWTFREAIK